ncbi:MAG TPA: transcriptional repressor [Acidimicrobiales bacterium]|nr:transcriptional repressor [Acidimicrobiales bacterium]
MNSTVDDLLAALRRAGGRVTTTRRATVETLVANTERHVSAEEIVAAVRTRHSDVAESTVYRTLGTLEDLGLITHMHLDHGPATFHLAEDGHRHLVCRDCHAVVETPADLYDGLTAELEQRYGFELDREHFALTGRCRACRDAG